MLLIVVSQAYTVNLMEESVLRGNAALLKCHISTFVTEYVSVSSWIITEGETLDAEIHHNETSDLGIYLDNVLRLFSIESFQFYHCFCSNCQSEVDR